MAVGSYPFFCIGPERIDVCCPGAFWGLPVNKTLRAGVLSVLPARQPGSQPWQERKFFWQDGPPDRQDGHLFRQLGALCYQRLLIFRQRRVTNRQLGSFFGRMS